MEALILIVLFFLLQKLLLSSNMKGKKTQNTSLKVLGLRFSEGLTCVYYFSLFSLHKNEVLTVDCVGVFKLEQLN